MQSPNLANLTTQYQQAYLIYCYKIIQYMSLLAWMEQQQRSPKPKVKPKSASRVKKLAQRSNQEKPTLKSLKHQGKSNVNTIVAMGFPNGAMSAAFRVAFNEVAGDGVNNRKKEENTRTIKAKLLTVREGIDHSALYLSDDGTGNGPVLYDPAGNEFRPKGPGTKEMRFSDLFTGKAADPNMFIQTFNGDVDVINFTLTQNEALLISSEFNVGTSGLCAINCGTAISQVPRFKDVGGIHPGTLHSSLQNALDNQTNQNKLP